ncbi:sugar kinase [Microbulbifer magnicolonia]|uniref:sugar kinase n=1 Tax=Microbulbifer magnicolonia TaxID=3109744 RepID=UPI002B40059B|nr:sugar kinase [Microbulbifer sp. GG15]
MKIAALGEVMVELAPQKAQSGGTTLMAQSFAGDTYNTAVYMARNGVEVSYVTLLGDDPFSEQMLAQIRAEGIDTSAIAQLPGRCPGLYAIQNSPDGERQFTYWRGESPARELFAEAGVRVQLQAYLQGMDYLYLSGITLAIMAPDACEHLLAFLTAFRRDGGRVAFDSNYRPRLWRSADEAREVLAAFLMQTDIALLTLEDEQALWGDRNAGRCLERNGRFRLAELVLKRGAESVLLQYDGELSAIAVPRVPEIVDTTGAGDAFNAGYLAARLQGEEPESAVSAGNRCAAAVIRHRGAIIPAAQYAGGCVAGRGEPARLVRA